MKAAVLALTPGGAELGATLAAALAADGWETALYLPRRLAGPGSVPYDGTLGGMVARLFPGHRALVLVMAMGIAVRVLAPHLRDKRTDPAVVVLDERGRFAVSVLSGHLGGANELARRLAEITGGRAVVTTATDVLGLTAPDELARKYGLFPEPFPAVRAVNAALAAGEAVPLYTEVPLDLAGVRGLVPRPWAERAEPAAGWRVLVTDRAEEGGNILYLRPRRFCAGVGTRAGIGKHDVLAALAAACQKAGLGLGALRALATADLKAGEPGLVAAAAELGLPLYSFPRPLLDGMIREAGLAVSALVQEKVGVGGVCEPASLLAAGATRLVLPKTVHRGVTVALSEGGWPWSAPDPARWNI